MKANKFTKLMAIVLTMLLVAGLLPMTAMAAQPEGLYVNGVGPYTTSSSVYQAIHGAWNSGVDTVVVSGSLTMGGQLSINSTVGKRIVWEAEYASDTAVGASVIFFGGPGTFELAGGTIIQTGVGMAAFRMGAGTNLIVSSGTISAATNAINSLGSTIINGGTVISGGSYATILGSDTTVNDGTVRNTGSGGAISVGNDNEVYITGGTIIADTREAVSGGSGSSVTVSGGFISSANTLNGGGTINVHNAVVTGGAVENTATNGYAFYNERANGLVYVNGGTVEVARADSVKYSMGSNAIAIEVAASTTGNAYTAGTSVDLTVAGASASAVWDVDGTQHGIRYTRGTNIGFIEVPGVTVSEPQPEGLRINNDPTLYTDITALNMAIYNTLGQSSIDTVTVRGRLTVNEGVASLSLSIPEGKRVVWEADYTCNINVFSLISLGSGTFELEGGSVVLTTGTGIAILMNGNSPNLVVSSGTVSAAGTAIGNNVPNCTITINGGTVVTSGSSATVHGAATVITVNDGMVRNTGSGAAITANENSDVFITGGMVISDAREAVSGGVGSRVTVSGGTVSSANTLNGGGTIRAQNAVFIGGTVENTAANGYAFYNDRANGLVYVNGGEVTVARADGVKYSMGSNAVAIEVAESTTGNRYTAGTSVDLIVAGTSASAVWDVDGTQYGIRYTRGTNNGFIEVPDVTVTATQPEGLYVNDVGPYSTTNAVSSAVLGAFDFNDTVTVSGRLTLGSSGTISFTIPEDKRVVWEADFTTITNTYGSFVSPNIDVAGSGTLEVTGGSIIKNGTGYYGVAIRMKDANANLIVSGGTVRSTSYNAIIMNANTTLTVTGGTVSSTNDIAISALAENTTVTVSGGTVESEASTTISGSLTSGAVTISGGTVRNTYNGSAISGFTVVNVTDGNVTADTAPAIYRTNGLSSGNDATVAISGGTVSSASQNGTIRMNNGGNVWITGGGIVENTGNGNAVVCNIVGLIYVNGGKVEVARADGVNYSVGVNAIAIEVAESTTGNVYTAGTSVDLIVAGTSASAVWAISEDDQPGIAYARGTNTGFIEVEGVTVITTAEPIYNPGDIAVINAIIDNNSLDWTKADPADGSYAPADWTGVTWSNAEKDKRIEYLDLRYKALTGALDVSGLTELLDLVCYNNSLTEINVRGLTSLRFFYCYYNQLTSLDVSGLTSLLYFYCDNNQISTLDVSGLPSLKELKCNNNQLSTLDVSGLTSLSILSCRSNLLSTLDVSGLTSLILLSCADNDLIELVLDEDAPYMSIDVIYNYLADENAVTGKTIEWNGNSFRFWPQKILLLDSIAITEPPAKTTYFVGDTLDLTDMVVTATYSDASTEIITNYSTDPADGAILDNVGTTTVTISYTEGDVAKTTSFTITVNAIVVPIYNPGDIAVINAIIDNNNLNWTKADPADGSYAPADWTGVSWSGAETNKRIELLSITQKNLTGDMDVSGLTSLEVLYCGSNKLTKLDISGLTFLTKLMCEANQLKELDVSGLTSLEMLNCSDNDLTGLGLDEAALYSRIDVRYNYLADESAVTGQVLPWGNIWYTFWPQKILLVDSIEITEQPTKVTYVVGEALDLTDMVVTATYKDESTATVTDYTTNPAGGDVLNNVGTQTVTVSYEGFSDDFAITVNEAPTYSASIDPSASHSFHSATVGYGVQDAQVFTIINTGTGTLTGLSAALSSGASYEISIALSGAIVEPGEAATVSVRPKTGLVVGWHTDTLTVAGDNGISLPVNLGFTVNATPTYALTVSAGSGGSVTGATSGNYEAGTSINVTATPASGYRFVNWIVNGATITGGNTANPAIFTMPTNEVTLTANFEVIPVVLTGIVVTAPTTTTYTVGQALDLAGMAVTAYYSNDTSEPVTSGFTTIPAAGAILNDIGSVTVTVSYGGFSDTFTVTVNAAPIVLTGIVVTAPTTMIYTVGQALDLAGMAVTAYYSNDTSEPVTSGFTTIPAAGTILNDVGSVTVTVSYGGFSDTFTVTVNAAPVVLTGIVVTAPTTTTYTVGQALDLTGMAVTAYYSNDTSEPVTAGYTIDPAAGAILNDEGNVTVTVSYGGFSDTFIVTVNAIPTYALSVSAGAGGSVTGATSGNYEAGTSINVTATPATGYRFVNWSVNGAVITGGNTANPAAFTMPTNEVTLTANFEVIPVVLTGIVVTAPTTTTYTVGQALDLAGMAVTAYYSNDTSEPVTSGYTTDPAAGAILNDEGNVTVTVSYGGFSDTFTVTVNAAPVVLTGIAVTAPTTTTYTVGQALDLTGMAVTAYYSNDTSEPVTSGYTTDPAAGAILNDVGSVTVTISYGGFSDTFVIEVKPPVTGPTDVEVLQQNAAAILKNGLPQNNLVLTGKTLTLVIDGKEFVLSTNANNRNISGEIYLGDGYWLVFDIKGNGSNIKDFKIVFRG